MYQINFWWSRKNNGRQHNPHNWQKWSLKNSTSRKRSSRAERSELHNAYGDRMAENTPRGL